MIRKAGVRMLGFADNGVRHFTNSSRPIRSPADMKGLKIRIMPSPVFQRLVESLGASASAIPWAELPTALQQRVVDGQENGVTNILAASLYQHQKYISLNGHVWSVHAYLMNERFYQGLSATEKQAVQEGHAGPRVGGKGDRQGVRRPPAGRRGGREEVAARAGSARRRARGST
jgi:TRAP-type transport system periplasmic protein